MSLQSRLIKLLKDSSYDTRRRVKRLLTEYDVKEKGAEVEIVKTKVVAPKQTPTIGETNVRSTTKDNKS